MVHLVCNYFATPTPDTEVIHQMCSLTEKKKRAFSLAFVMTYRYSLFFLFAAWNSKMATQWRESSGRKKFAWQQAKKCAFLGFQPISISGEMALASAISPFPTDSIIGFGKMAAAALRSWIIRCVPLSFSFLSNYQLCHRGEIACICTSHTRTLMHIRHFGLSLFLSYFSSGRQQRHTNTQA